MPHDHQNNKLHFFGCTRQIQYVVTVADQRIFAAQCLNNMTDYDQQDCDDFKQLYAGIPHVTRMNFFNLFHLLGLL